MKKTLLILFAPYVIAYRAAIYGFLDKRTWKFK